MHLGDLLRRVGNIGKTAGHELIERGAEAVDIAAHVGRNSGQLLGTDVLRSSHDLVADFLILVGAGDPGEAEVRQFGEAVAVEHDVVRLDVLVDELLFAPGGVKRPGYFADDTGGHGEFKLLFALQNLLECFTANELHREIEDAVLFADRIGLHDIRVADLAGGTGFAEQTVDILLVIQKLILQYLQRHRAVQGNLFGQKNLAHPALAQGAFNHEVTDYSAGTKFVFRKFNRSTAFRAGDGIPIRRNFRAEYMITLGAVNFHRLSRIWSKVHDCSSSS